MTAVAPATGAPFFTRAVLGGADQVGGSVIFSGTTENAAGNPLYIAPATGASFAVTGAFFQATQPVSGTVGVSGSVAVTGTFFQATQPVSIASPVAVTGSFFQATQPVSATALPLPTGAATSASQTTGNTSLASIDTKTPALSSGRVPVDGSGVTQPVSASALPLPAGASTSANQSTGNTSLASIDGKTPALVSGAVPVVDSALATLLGTPATELPPTPLMISSGLTHYKLSSSTAQTISIVAAATGQTVRVHLLDLSIASDATGHMFVDICSNTTVLRRYKWTAGQGLFTGYDSRPLFKSAAGETINIITSGTLALEGRISFVQSV